MTIVELLMSRDGLDEIEAQEIAEDIRSQVARGVKTRDALLARGIHPRELVGAAPPVPSAVDIFLDFPPLTPGRITYGVLKQIVAWRDRHGIGDDRATAAALDACRDEGQGAAQAGLELGLIDYGQATGDPEY